jgi:hypothetical protein
MPYPVTVINNIEINVIVSRLEMVAARLYGNCKKIRQGEQKRNLTKYEPIQRLKYLAASKRVECADAESVKKSDTVNRIKTSLEQRLSRRRPARMASIRN